MDLHRFPDREPGSYCVDNPGDPDTVLVLIYGDDRRPLLASVMRRGLVDWWTACCCENWRLALPGSATAEPVAVGQTHGSGAPASSLAFRVLNPAALPP